jgi:hypothetical protein
MQKFWHLETTFLEGEITSFWGSSTVTQHSLSSASFYCEAMGLSEASPPEDKALPTAERIKLRVGRLEHAAMACRVSAAIHYSRVCRSVIHHMLSSDSIIPSEQCSRCFRVHVAITATVESRRGHAFSIKPVFFQTLQGNR